MIRNRGGYWQVKVYAGLDPLTGKQRFEYDRAKTKREAVRVEAALKTKVAEGRSRGNRRADGRRPGGALVRVAPGRQGDLPTTLEGYRRQIDQRIIPALGRIPVRRLDVETPMASTPSCAGVARPAASRCRPAPSAPSTPCCPGRCVQAVAWGWDSAQPGPAGHPAVGAAQRRGPATGRAGGRPVGDRARTQPQARPVPAAGGGARRPPRELRRAGTTSIWIGARSCWSAAWCT